MDQKEYRDFLKLLKVTLTYLRLYPPNSQVILGQIEKIYNWISERLNANNEMIISEIGGIIIIDGEELNNPEILNLSQNLGEHFIKTGLKSVKFVRGLGAEELKQFLLEFAPRQMGNWAERKIGPHLEFNQVRYVAIGPEEEITKKISELTENVGQDISEVITLIRRSYDLIEEKPAANKELLYDHLARRLARLDPLLLQEIFDRELPPKIEQSRLKERLLQSLGQQQISELFSEIKVWYEEIRQREKGDFTAVEQLNRLKKFIKKILTSPAAQQVSFKIYEDLLKLGLLDELPEWLKGQETKNIIAEVENWLKEEPAYLLSAEVGPKISSAAEQLIVLGINELLTKLLVHLSLNLSAKSANSRQTTIDLLLALRDILARYGKENFSAAWEPEVIKAIETEDIPENYQKLLGLLFARLEIQLLTGEWKLAQLVLEVVLRHLSDEYSRISPIPAGVRAELIRYYQNILAERILPVLEDTFRQPAAEEGRLLAIGVFRQLGQRYPEILVKIIKHNPEYRLRRLAAETLKMLPEAGHLIAEELNLGLVAEEIKNFLSVLDILWEGNFEQQLINLLAYPAPDIQRQIIRFLARQKSPALPTILLSAVENPELASLAINLLGELRIAQAVDVLGQKILSTNFPFAEEAIIALGNIGHPDAVKYILKLLRPRWLFFGPRNKEILQIRALWVLRKFPKEPRIIQVLEKFSRHRTSALRLVATETLQHFKK